MRSRTFFGRNSIPNNFYLKLVLMQCAFLAMLSHKLNIIYHIKTYSIREFNNPTDTSAENVTLCGGFTELAELNYLCIYTLYNFDDKYIWRGRNVSFTEGMIERAARIISIILK